MTLRLRFQGSGAVPGGPQEIELREGVLTVGRGAENDLVLPDPDRVISKRHCVIEERNGMYVLLDTSTNGTFLNFAPERISEDASPLADGDVIGLGGYELVVVIEDPNAPFAPAEPEIAPPLPPDSLIEGGPRATDGFVGGLDDPGTDGDDFLDDLLASQIGNPGSGRKVDPLQAEDPLGAGPVIPEDDSFLDGLLEPAPLPAQSGASEAHHTPSPSDHFAAPAAQNALIPDDWDEEFGGGAPEPTPPAPAAPAPPPAAAPAPPAPEPLPPAGSPEDPFADLGAPPPAGSDTETSTVGPSPAAPEPEPAPPPTATPPPRPRPAPAASPVARPQPQAPRPAPGPVEPAPAPPAQVSAAASPGANEAARAFLEALTDGRSKLSDEELVETMAQLGRVMRVMIEGVREVLMTRASIKQEFRMAQTTIRAGGNNPLKFSISPEQAIDVLIKSDVPGYLDPERAASEALDDIKAHEVAMMTGMEAALKGLLTRVDPAELASKIEVKGGLSDFFGGKKARYWEVYEKMYAEIAREAEDDFHRMFGREFARAYEEQLRKL